MSGEVVQRETKQEGKVTNADLAARIDGLEASLKAMQEALSKVLERIDVGDKPVNMPVRKNYNPDYLPVGGKPRGLHELPPKTDY
jgi:hypothetical protein